VFALLALAGCDERSAPPAPEGRSTAARAQAPPAQVAVASTAAETPLPDATERDPRTVLIWWAKALSSRDWTSARRVWGNFGAASGLSAQEFAARWEPYRTLEIEIGEGEQEGAAGSLFYEAPVTITGETQDGASYSLAGTVILRRVNDVEGATPEQLRWHIEQSTLAP
jgi:hypothetical protein